MRRVNVLSSNVFRRSIVASAGFIVLAMALVWAFGTLRLWQIDRAEWLAVDEAVVEVEQAYAEGGLEAAIDLYMVDGVALWEDELLYERLEEGEPVAVLRLQNNEAFVGFDGLWPSEDRELVWLDHEDIDEPLRAMAFGLEAEVWGTIGRFVPEEQYYWQWVIPQMMMALLVVGLPLSLTIGYFLSRGVLGRIEAISDTAEDVTAGRMRARIELQGTGDEFDRLSTKINGMLDRVEQLNRNIEAVSVGVAHDLKTPLANIGGRLELIRRDMGNEAATRGHVEAAEGYLDGLLRVFDALLRLGEVESGRRRAGFANVDLSALATEMGETYGPLFEDAQKTLSVAVTPLQVVRGDGDLVQQLLANLLENALEHARDAAQVSVAVYPGDDGVILRVGDDGPGISPTDRARLFERFYRGDQSRNTPGNGLGLSLVKAIADLHEADITLLDDPQGTVFEVKFKSALKSYETV